MSDTTTAQTYTTILEKNIPLKYTIRKVRRYDTQVFIRGRAVDLYDLVVTIKTPTCVEFDTLIRIEFDISTEKYKKNRKVELSKFGNIFNISSRVSKHDHNVGFNTGLFNEPSPTIKKIHEYTGEFEGSKFEMLNKLRKIKLISGECIGYQGTDNNFTSTQQVTISSPDELLNQAENNPVGELGIDTDYLKPDIQTTPNNLLDTPLELMDYYKSEPITMNVTSVYIPNAGTLNTAGVGVQNSTQSPDISTNPTLTIVEELGRNRYRLPYSGFYILKFNRLYTTKYKYGFSFPNSGYTDINYILIPNTITYDDYKRIFLNKLGKDIFFDQPEPLLYYPLLYSKLFYTFIRELNVLLQSQQSGEDSSNPIEVINQFLNGLLDVVKTTLGLEELFYNIFKYTLEGEVGDISNQIFGENYIKLVSSLFYPPTFDYYTELVSPPSNIIEGIKSGQIDPVNYISTKILPKYFIPENLSNPQSMLRLLLGGNLLFPPLPVPPFYSEKIITSIVKFLHNYNPIMAYIFKNIVSKYLLGITKEKFVVLISTCQPNIHIIF